MNLAVLSIMDDSVHTNVCNNIESYNQLRRGDRAWPMFAKSGAAMAAPAAPMPPPMKS